MTNAIKNEIRYSLSLLNQPEVRYVLFGLVILILLAAVCA